MTVRYRGDWCCPQLAEATFHPLPFDAGCARAYGLVCAQTLTAGRKAPGSRAVDLLIAATALANELPLKHRQRRRLQQRGSLQGMRDRPLLRPSEVRQFVSRLPIWLA
jgi:hypothetical protein